MQPSRVLLTWEPNILLFNLCKATSDRDYGRASRNLQLQLYRCKSNKLLAKMLIMKDSGVSCILV